MPRAVIAEELGPLENYSLRDYDPGAPGPGQLRIKVKAAGVSFVDVLNATGKYQIKAPVPFIPGSEFSGQVEAIGDDVEGFAVGDAVMATTWGGAFAQSTLAQASSVNPVPEGMGFAEAAVFSVSATTAWHALVDRGQLQAGETLLVLGAGGATGYAAVQIGKYLNARVIASASSEAKRAIALAAGADAVVDAGSPDWRDDIKACSNGKRVDVVFDPVGGQATEAAFRCLGWNGRHLVIGFPGGIASLPTNLPLLKSASLVGVNLQQLSVADPEKGSANIRQLCQLAGQGQFHPVIAETYPLEEFFTALQSAAAGQSAGRIVLLLD